VFASTVATPKLMANFSIDSPLAILKLRWLKVLLKVLDLTKLENELLEGEL
jgi:hypothetical protein